MSEEKTCAVKVADTRVKSLGVALDSTLSFDQHVNNVCKTAHYHVRALRHIRRCMSVDDESRGDCSGVFQT